MYGLSKIATYIKCLAHLLEAACQVFISSPLSGRVTITSKWGNMMRFYGENSEAETGRRIQVTNAGRGHS